jgi:hypothetical protein
MAYKRKRTFTKRPMKRKALRKTSKKTFAKRVKSAVMKVSETKKTQRAFAKIEMFHNVFSATQCYHLNAASNMPSGGSSTFARVGDRMNTLGWKVRLLVGQKGDRLFFLFFFFSFFSPIFFGPKIFF